MRGRGPGNSRAQRLPAWWPDREGLLLCAFLLVLTIAGGGSRADIMGQVVVRAVTGVALVIAALTWRREPLGTHRTVMLMVILAIALPLIQLVPLPPAWWQSLPGRTPIPAEPSLWRPISLSPGGTINAAMALTVPLATALLIVVARDQDRLPGFLLILILVSALLGALQFSGAGFYSPLVNTTPGSVVGFFANRNHFALFLAIGCLIAPVWGFAGRRKWRAYSAPLLCALFLLLIVASGSRSGIGLGIVAVVLGVAIARVDIKQRLATLPPRTRWIVAAATVGVVGLILVSALASGRAVSINRAMAMDLNDDMRLRAMPVVLSMIAPALPFGNGFGSFDVSFRHVEPTALLKPTYFNHAHNDFLEIIIDGGIPALVLLLVVLGWWITATVRVWRQPSSKAVLIGRVGSGVLLLCLVASIVDYPARTPLILAMIVIGAMWLARGASNAHTREDLVGH